MLKYFVENNYVKFADEAKDWKDAIRMSCETLEKAGAIEEKYKEDIIACVEKYGPYIVIAPNIALPHSQEGEQGGVHKTAIAFMKLEKAVSFEEGNPECDAQLFFTLASCNPEQHLENMSKLSDMLCNDELVEELLSAKNIDDLLKLQEKYID